MQLMLRRSACQSGAPVSVSGRQAGCRGEWGTGAGAFSFVFRCSIAFSSTRAAAAAA